MNPSHDHPVHNLPPVQIKPPFSPRITLASPTFFTPTGSSATPTSIARRRVGIAVDLSDESAYAVNWAVQNYLRPGDAVILLHVRSTSVLYGADWGATAENPETPSQQTKLEEDFDNLTTKKLTHLAQPLAEAHVPFKVHMVKDHDMKERLCLEVERLGLSAVITGSRGLGAVRTGGSRGGLLGSVSDYCVQHCVCPVVVVRDPGSGREPVTVTVEKAEKKAEEVISGDGGQASLS